MTLPAEIIHDYLVLFAMVNAVGNLPVFAEFTRSMDVQAKGRVFRLATVTAATIVFSFAIFGHWMLKSVFEVDFAAFRIAGGILVFAVAARGVMQGPRVAAISKSRYDNVAVFPLGFPFLAGPGTIVTTILLFQSSGIVETAVAVLAVYLSVLPILYLSTLIERTIGSVGVLVVTRILYVFICAKATSFIIDGIRLSFFS
jgi:multiple antibiotic resistance protein